MTRRYSEQNTDIKTKNVIQKHKIQQKDETPQQIMKNNLSVDRTQIDQTQILHHKTCSNLFIIILFRNQNCNKMNEFLSYFCK